MNPRAAPLSLSLKRRAEIVGFVFGLLCFPATHLTENVGRGTGPPSIVLPLVAMGALAGACGCRLGFLWAGDEGAGSAPRVGIRAGWVAALVGGATVVATATFRAFVGTDSTLQLGAFTPVLPILPSARPFAVLLVALLGIPPAVFFGIVGSLLAAMQRAPRVRNGKARQPAFSITAVFVGILVLCAAGYLSPFATVFRPKTTPIAVAMPTPIPVQSVSSPAPRWHYEKPSKFDAAEAEAVIVSDVRNLGDIDQMHPWGLSPDQRRFAAIRHGFNATLEVWDLDSLDQREIKLQKAPEALAWSPEGGRLLLTIPDEPRHFEVVDLRSGQVTPLPQPLGPLVPKGPSIWWHPQEVLFTEGANSLALRLDTLRIGPAPESSKSTALSMVERGTHLAAAPHLPANSHRTLDFRPVLLANSPAMDSSQKDLRRERLHVVFESPQRDYRHRLQGLDLDQSDQLLGTSDGTKIIRIRGTQVSVFYLSLRDVPPLRFSLTMPEAPGEALRAKLERKNICALVCEPVINPLNGNIVGPDRSKVKGIARILTWNGPDAEFWISEEGPNIASGDVVADLCTFENGNPRFVEKFRKDEWFAVIRDLKASPAPGRNEAPRLEHDWTVHIQENRLADCVFGFAVNQSSQADAAMPPKPATPFDIFSTPAAKPHPPTAATPVPATPWPPKATPADSAAVLRQFMAEHVAKSNRGDAEGFAGDFSPDAVYYTMGAAGRAKIADTVRSGHAKFPQARLTIKSMKYTPVSPTDFDVLATMEYAETKGGRRVLIQATNERFSVVLTPAGPSITRVTLEN